jgi:hypothetical protein
MPRYVIDVLFSSKLVIRYFVLMLFKYDFNSSHMHNVLLLLQLNAKQNFRRYREPVDRQEWIEYGPTTINAFYRPLFNDISRISSSRTMNDLCVSFFSYSSWYSSTILLSQRCSQVKNPSVIKNNLFTSLLDLSTMVVSRDSICEK